MCLTDPYRDCYHSNSIRECMWKGLCKCMGHYTWKILRLQPLLIEDLHMCYCRWSPRTPQPNQMVEGRSTWWFKTQTMQILGLNLPGLPCLAVQWFGQLLNFPSSRSLLFKMGIMLLPSLCLENGTG